MSLKNQKKCIKNLNMKLAKRLKIAEKHFFFPKQNLKSLLLNYIFPYFSVFFNYLSDIAY